MYCSFCQNTLGVSPQSVSKWERGETFPDITLLPALALCDDANNLSQAVALCERVLSRSQGDKVHHTTRAALCFIYLKVGERDKAIAAAKSLPHLRESREMILTQVEKDLSTDEINSYLKFIAIGENDEQSVVRVGIDPWELPCVTSVTARCFPCVRVMR